MAETQVPEAQSAINELAAGAQTPEEQATLAEWQQELDAERAQALGSTATKPQELVDLGDGTVVTKAEAEQLAKQGNGATSPYSNGRRG